MAHSAVRIMKNRPVAALLFLLALFPFAQSRLCAQEANQTIVVVIQRGVTQAEGDWLQFAAEDALINKIGALPGWQASGWLQPPEGGEDQSANALWQKMGARWTVQPEASLSAEENRISIRLVDLRSPAQPKVVEASTRPGRLPFLLTQAIRVTLQAMGVEKDQVDASAKTGVGTNSNLALERFYEASVDWILGDMEVALAGYESSLVAAPDFEPARRAIANGKFDLAHQAFLQQKWTDATSLFNDSAAIFRNLADRASAKLPAATSDDEKKILQSQIEANQDAEKTCQPWAHLCQGLALRDQDDLEGARSEFQAALQIDPQFPAARSALAGLQLAQAQELEQKGDLAHGRANAYSPPAEVEPQEQEAKRYFAQALEGYLAAGEAYSSLNDLLSEGLALAGASRAAEKQADPSQAVALLLEAAKRYTSGGDYRSARNLLLGPSYSLAAVFGLVDDNPSRSKAHFLLAVGFMRSSERSLLEDSESTPEGIRRFKPTGEVMTEGDISRWKKDKAVEEAVKATNLDPTDAASFLLLGKAYLFADNPDSLARAIEAFSKAQDLLPQAIEPKVLLGESLYQANHLKEAEEELLAACQLPVQPGQEAWANRAWGALGGARNRLRKYPEAAEAFEKAVSYSPTDAISFLGWAVALFQQGKYQESQEKLAQAKSLAPYLPGIEKMEGQLKQALAAKEASPQ